MKSLFLSLGDGLLVYPIAEADVNQVSIYFPGENSIWYDIRTFAQHNGSETILINVDMESVKPFRFDENDANICFFFRFPFINVVVR